METTQPLPKLSRVGRLAFLVTVMFAAASCGEKKAAEASRPYPLEKCIVSGEKLGEHGKPFVFVYQGQEIKMCCKSCLDDFNEKPAEYLKQIAAAAKKDSQP